MGYNRCSGQQYVEERPGVISLRIYSLVLLFYKTIISENLGHFHRPTSGSELNLRPLLSISLSPLARQAYTGQPAVVTRPFYYIFNSAKPILLQATAGLRTNRFLIVDTIHVPTMHHNNGIPESQDDPYRWRSAIC